MADGGSLFLDEIGELPLNLQAKLLGVMDTGEIRRLGSGRSFTVNVRVVAATNVELERAVADNRFREDLYYRMSVMRIHIPPLRERKADVDELVNHFIREIAPDRKLQIHYEEIARLKQYSWPGNVRELRNIVERAIILSRGRYISPSQLIQYQDRESDHDNGTEHAKIVSTLEEVEKRYITKVFHHYDKNRTRTAKALGIARSTLIRKLELYEI